MFQLTLSLYYIYKRVIIKETEIEDREGGEDREMRGGNWERRPIGGGPGDVVRCASIHTLHYLA